MSEVKTIQMVFARETATTKNETIQVWYVLDQDGNIVGGEEDYKLYFKACKKPFPGAVYLFDNPEGTTVRNARYHGLYHDEELRLKWNSLHRGYHDEKALERRHAKDSKDDPLEPLLDKLNREYNRLIGDSRTMFLARCLAKITRGKKL